MDGPGQAWPWTVALDESGVTVDGSGVAVDGSGVTVDAMLTKRLGVSTGVVSVTRTSNTFGHGWGTGQGTGKYATIRLSGETWNHLHMQAGA